MRRRLIGFLATLAFAHSPVGAQEARPEDVSSVDGVMRAYYEVVSGPEGPVADAERDRRSSDESPNDPSRSD